MFIRDKKIRPNVMLKYYLDLSKTNYLHWGLWGGGEELTLKNFQAAQERYIDHLISLIPKDVKTILDVGCGVGGNAIKLREKGYDVVSMSPDPYQQKLFLERTGGGIPFVLSTFEDYKADRKFDMVFMSESVQYIPIGKAFAKAKEVLRDGGYILSSDYYRLENSRGLKAKFLPSFYLKDYLELAEAHGFEKLKEDDISSRVAPTLLYGNMVFGNYVKPTLKALLLAFEVHIPIVYRMMKLFMRLKVKGERVEDVIKNNVVPLRPEQFEEHMKYLVFLFRKAAR